MIAYPEMNPVALQLGPVAIHWYGVLYLIAFTGCYFLLKAKKQLTLKQLDDLIFYAAIGVIVGGRLGYVVFYGFSFLKDNLWFPFQIWKGGMSFHGGLIGVIVAMYWVARKEGKSFLWMADFVAPVVPFGLAMGRLGNFINGELWGRVTDVPWAMVFPGTAEPRHPSSLYELGLEGILLFCLLMGYARKPRRPGQIAGLFALGYGICRIFVEQFRSPDAQIGLLFHYFTLGQFLSLPMILVGLYLWMRKPTRGTV